MAAEATAKEEAAAEQEMAVAAANTRSYICSAFAGVSSSGPTPSATSPCFSAGP